MNIETFKYDNRIVRAFAIATVIWGIVGMLVGLLAAVQLFFPDANLNFQFITFGLLGEMLARTYHESQGKPIYVIRDLLE